MYYMGGKRNQDSSADSEFVAKKATRKRNKKAITKKIDLREKKEEIVGDNEKRKVPEGVSVFDLIMPWKSEVPQSQDTNNLQKDGLSKVVPCSTKSKVLDVSLDDHAFDVQAVLMNPPWENSYLEGKQ